MAKSTSGVIVTRITEWKVLKQILYCAIMRCYSQAAAAATSTMACVCVKRVPATKTTTTRDAIYWLMQFNWNAEHIVVIYGDTIRHWEEIQYVRFKWWVKEWTQIKFAWPFKWVPLSLIACDTIHMNENSLFDLDLVQFLWWNQRKRWRSRMLLL